MLAVSTLWAEPPLPTVLKDLPQWRGDPPLIEDKLQNNVFIDGSGQIVVSYVDPTSKRRITFRFWLASRVIPKVSINISARNDGNFQYVYSIENGKDAPVALAMWSIVVPPLTDLKPEHATWKGFNPFHTVVAPQPFLTNAPKGVFANWQGRIDARLQPGATLENFSLTCSYRPGITAAYFAGAVPGIHPPEGELPEPVAAQLVSLQAPPVYWKVEAVIGPKFPPETPVAAILQTYERDIADLIRGGYLQETEFVKELRINLLNSVRSGTVLASVDARPESALERQLLAGLRVAAGLRE